MPEVSVIVVSKDSLSFLKRCLESVYNQTYSNFEVITVDNDSCDGTVDFIKENYPTITLIANKKNLGFCMANNQAIEVAKGKFILTLNPDVYLDKNYIKNIVDVISDLKRVGMATGKLLKFDLKHIDSCGLYLSKSRRLFDIGQGRVNDNFNSRRYILGPCAAAAVYKKEMLDEIKHFGEYFDNDFFFLVEDFDIAWRAQHKGWRAIFIPDAIGYHFRNSSNCNRDYIQYLSFRNRIFLLLKNEKINSLLMNLPFILSYDVLRLIYISFINRYTLKVICDIFKSTPRIFKKRKIIFNSKKNKQ
ncbi:MAG: glycosyltransferase family 2 protein [Candidatus Omnitrophica bacterium]|nr:glycosyltransferase family 2 protein [Candidatus Omnitrophota bacterium]